MKIYIAYKFTGEDLEILKNEMGHITSSLKKNGHVVYCSIQDEEFFSSNKYTNRQIFDHAISELRESDAILAYIKSDQKSEGMLLEIGYALANRKKIILALKKGIKTVFLREIADKVIEFEDFEDLVGKINYA